MTDNPPRTEDNSPSLSQPSKQKHEPGLGGDAAILHLVECLGSDEFQVRWDAAIKLGEIGDARAIETLMSFLKGFGDERPVKALANIGLPALPYLVSLLGHSNWYVSYHAAVALVGLGDKGIAEAVTLSQSDNPQIRWLAVLALERIRYPHDTPATSFIETLYVRHPPMNDFFVRLLGKNRNNPAVVSRLQSLMNDDSVHIHIRRLAAASLAFMGHTDGVELLIPVMVGGLGGPWTIWHALASLGEQVLPFLKRELEKEDVQRRHMHIMQLLGDIKSPDAVSLLVMGLRSSDPLVQGEAAHFLSKCADSRSTGALIATLNDQYYYVQFCAARALLEIGTQEAQIAVEQWRLSLPPDAQYRFDNGSIFG